MYVPMSDSCKVGGSKSRAESWMHKFEQKGVRLSLSVGWRLDAAEGRIGVLMLLWTPSEPTVLWVESAPTTFGPGLCPSCRMLTTKMLDSGARVVSAELEVWGWDSRFGLGTLGVGGDAACMCVREWTRSLRSHPDDCFGPVSEHRVRHATNHKMHSRDWSVYLGVRPRCYQPRIA